jgi:hypothetical protein
MKESRGVVNEIWNHTPAQIELPKVLISHNHLGGSIRVSGKSTMDMEYSGEISTATGSRDPAQRKGLHRFFLQTCGILKEKIKVRSNDRHSCSSIRKANHSLVDGRGFVTSSTQNIGNCVADGCGAGCCPVHPPFEHSEHDIVVALNEPTHLSALLA